MKVVGKSTTMSRSSEVIRSSLLSISLLFLFDNARSSNNGFACLKCYAYLGKSLTFFFSFSCLNLIGEGGR